MTTCDLLADDVLVERFEALTLPVEAFRHREHVRVAFAMLRGTDFGAGAARFRDALQRFAAHAGAPGKYDAALTSAYLARIGERMAARACDGSLGFLADNADLLAPGAVR